MLKVRASEQADVPVLVDIWRRSVLATHDFLLAQDFREIEEIVARSICRTSRCGVVNEQNEQAVGFYRRMGFSETGRSDVDGDGRPYPLLHMRRQ